MQSRYYYTVRGNRFLIERAKNFAEDGRMIDGRGWFASRVIGSDARDGEWFATATLAEKACDSYATHQGNGEPLS